MLCRGILVVQILCCQVLSLAGQCTVNGGSDSESSDHFAQVLEEHDRKLESIYKSLSSAIEGINHRSQPPVSKAGKHSSNGKFQGYCEHDPVICDCGEIKASGVNQSGIYLIYVNRQDRRYYADVYCDMETEGGGWVVFQRRKDGSQRFLRNWLEYSLGFGSLSGEFWLGNEFLFLLTSTANYQLRIDLEDFDGEKRYASYSLFTVASSVDKYRLNVGGYSGNANDSLSFHNNQYFSTPDVDNDQATFNCAERRSGAWWYKDCTDSNLNGVYFSGDYSSDNREGITWYHWRGHQYSLKMTEMKLSRP